ncbi:MAG: leucine-rich repeat protein [Ruminococcus sp.]
MKCPNCGNEITGKFCTSCGTPAPAEEPVKEQKTQSDGFGSFAYDSQNISGTDGNNTQPNNYDSNTYNSQPAQPNNFSTDSYNSQPTPQPFDYNANNAYSNQPSGMPVNNGYTGQQFTNVPNSNMPNQPKKGMSGGKIAILVVSIVLGIIIILGIIIGVVACQVVGAAKKGFDNYISSYQSELSSFQSEINGYASDIYNSESSDAFSDDDGEIYDESSCCYYRIINGNEVSVTSVNLYDVVSGNYDTKSIEVKIPSTIDGKKVTDIYSAYTYNPTTNDDDEVQIKVIIPGSVRTVQTYAFLDCECLTEIVFEDGVESIDEEAIVECEDLKKITVPESVKTIGDYALGFLSSDGMSFDYMPVKDLVIVAKKGSTAEQFAKDNNIKVENN